MIRILCHPAIWPTGAKILSEAMNGNGTALLNLNAMSSPPHVAYDLVRSAVSCNDNMPFVPPSAEEAIDEWLYVYENVSRFVFSVVTSEPDTGCQHWSVTPPERFNGPWNHTLRNPILVASALVSLRYLP